MRRLLAENPQHRRTARQTSINDDGASIASNSTVLPSYTSFQNHPDDTGAAFDLSANDSQVPGGGDEVSIASHATYPPSYATVEDASEIIAAADNGLIFGRERTLRPSPASLEPPAEPPVTPSSSFDRPRDVSTGRDQRIERLLPSPEVVLSWDGTQTPAPSQEPRPHTTGPITYTFSTLSFNTMLLLPPSDAIDTRPLYHISVAHNCFVPLSYITTVRKGGTENGEFVGDFEMGLSQAKSRICIGDHQTFLNVFVSGTPQSSNWVCNFPDSRFRWVRSTRAPNAQIMNCYKIRLTDSGSPLKWQLLATFTPSDLLPSPFKRSASGASGSQELVVSPEAREKVGERSDRDLLDLILLSLLVVERMRLSVSTEH